MASDGTVEVNTVKKLLPLTCHNLHHVYSPIWPCSTDSTLNHWGYASQATRIHVHTSKRNPSWELWGSLRSGAGQIPTLKNPASIPTTHSCSQAKGNNTSSLLLSAQIPNGILAEDSRIFLTHYPRPIDPKVPGLCSHLCGCRTSPNLSILKF